MTPVRFICRCFVLIVCLWFSTGHVLAQEVLDGDEAADPSWTTLEELYPNIAEWEVVATRAENIASVEFTSLFALNQIRQGLFEWRDRFAANLSRNAGRIATLDAQLSALGPAPENGEEPAGIAERREELQAKRGALATPDALVAVAHARADGLLLEIDAMIRDKDARAIFERRETPLNPAHWPAAVAAYSEGITSTLAVTVDNTQRNFVSGELQQKLPLTILALGVALLLFWRGNGLLIALTQSDSERSPRRTAFMALFGSILRLLIPAVALFALFLGLQSLGIWSRQGSHLLSAVVASVGVIIVARWLSLSLFPGGPSLGPLSYEADTQDVMRRATMMLAVAVALVPVLSAIAQFAEPDDVVLAVMALPLQLAISWLLFRLGSLLRQPPTENPYYSGSGGIVRGLVGRAAVIIAVISPLLLGLGYLQASTYLLRSAVLTLAILGVVIVLQQLVYDTYSAATERDPEETGPLMPVVIAFALIIISLPFVALAWGARLSNLIEIWTRIATGFSIGETRITPADLMTFLLVFAGILLMTRFVQSTLRQNVLPRTQLDLGGQHAVVAGIGYLGIFIAGLVAITSAGIDLTSLAFVAGALSLGIGFGLQNIVQNFVSGIILLIERPIGEGDMIEVNGQLGYVRDISVRSTRIETFDRTDVIIPNADLVSNEVTNWTRGNLVGRLILPVGVAYGSDVDRVREILMDVAENHPMTLADPPPQIFFMGFGDNSLDFEVRVLLRDVNWKVVTQSELNIEINSRFAAEDIEIPFPQRDLWLRNPETLKGSDDV